MMRALFARGPDPIALALLGSLAPWAGGAAVPGPTAASISPAPIRARDLVPAPEGARAATVFALVWLAAFGLVVGPGAHRWSGYAYTPSAVGRAGLRLPGGGRRAGARPLSRSHARVPFLLRVLGVHRRESSGAVPLLGRRGARAALPGPAGPVLPGGSGPPAARPSRGRRARLP